MLSFPVFSSFLVIKKLKTKNKGWRESKAAFEDRKGPVKKNNNFSEALNSLNVFNFKKNPQIMSELILADLWIAHLYL